MELEDLIEEHVIPLIQEFDAWGYNKSPIVMYWGEYLTALGILLDYIWSDKGDWPLLKNYTVTDDFILIDISTISTIIGGHQFILFWWRPSQRR